MSNVDDVRPVLDFYRDEEDVVAAFRRNQDILRKQQEELLTQQQQQAASGGFFGRGLFGRVNMQNVHSRINLGNYCSKWGIS